MKLKLLVLIVLVGVLVPLSVQAYADDLTRSKDCGRLQSRIDNASAGGTINTPAGCMYREHVVVKKSLTINFGEGSGITGADKFDFSRSGGNWVSEQSLPALIEPAKTPDPKNPQLCESSRVPSCSWVEQVWVNGVEQRQVADGSDPAPGEFSVGSLRRVVLGSDPSGKTVEASVRQELFDVAGRATVTVRGGLFEKAANYRAFPAIASNGNSLTLDGVEVRYNHADAVSCGGAGSVCKLLNSKIHDNNSGGYGGSKAEYLIDNSQIYRNGKNPWVQYNDSYSESGIKITGDSAAPKVIRNSNLYENDSANIWTDVGARNVEIYGNRIHHGEEAGIHLEISNSVRIYDNAMWENGWEDVPANAGNSAAVYLSTAANVVFENNTLAWNNDGMAGIWNSGRMSSAPGNVFRDNTVIMSPSGTGKQLGVFFLPGSVDLRLGGRDLAYDNRYWFPGVESSERRYQWGTLTYASLSKFKGTPGEGGAGRYMSDAAKNEALKAAGIPLTPEH